MEIPDIAAILRQKRKKLEKEAFKVFPSSFFKTKGGKIEFIDGDEDRKYFEVTIGNRKIKVSIFRDEKPHIYEVDGRDFSVYKAPYDNLMFWDIFENGNEKYKLRKEVPEDFTFTARDHGGVFTYTLRYKDEPWENLVYPCNDVHWRVERIQRREKNRIYLKQHLQSAFPKGYYTRCYEKEDELQFDISAYILNTGLQYQARFIKKVDQPIMLHEQYSDDSSLQKQLTTIDKDGSSLDTLISHVQKNLQKFDL